MNINKITLQKALEIVKPGLSNKEIIEQSTSFAFIKGRVVTYNDEISISHPVEGLEIEGAIKADKLYALIQKIKKDEISIECRESEIVIQSGKSKASLTLEAEIKLPIESVSEIGKWKSLPDDFIKQLEFVIPACSKDMSKPVLTCLNITESGRIESSDSFRIIIALLNKAMPTKTFLLPAVSALQVIKLKPVKIAEGKGWIHFKTEAETILSCRIFEDTFPDVDPYMEVKGESIKFPKSIKEIIDRASVFAKRDFTLDETIVCTLANKRFKVYSEAEDGKYEEEVNTQYEGDAIEFHVSPSLLQSILSQTLDCIVSDNKLKFEGSNWVSVVCLKNPN